MRVICYVSCILFVVECNYLIIEKEVLVVVWVCEKFYIYLYGVEFELIIDYKLLEVFYGRKFWLNVWIECWLLKFMVYNFKVCYLFGY